MQILKVPTRRTFVRTAMKYFFESINMNGSY